MEFLHLFELRLFVLLTCTIIQRIVCSKAYKHYYLDEYCKYQITIEDPIILTLTKKTFYDHGYRCTVRVKGPRNRVISIQFTKFDVGQPHRVLCDDSLHIYDGEADEAEDITPYRGLCGVSIPQPLVSTQSDITLQFESQYMTVGTGFTAILTPLQADAMVKCNKSQFKCGDGFCVDRQYVCDGHYNCMTQKDESAQFADCQGVTAVWTDFTNIMKISLILLIGAAVLSFVGLVLYFSNKQHHRKIKQKL